MVIVLGLALLSCNGPNRGRNTQPSSPSGFNLRLTASPNVVRGATVGTGEAQGGCSTIQATVFDENGALVNGATVTLSTTLGRFPPTPARQEAVAVSGPTALGIFTDVLCAKAERGTATVTGTVENATAVVLITII